MICELRGGTSSLELYDDYLVIKPSNIQKLSGSTNTIPLDSVVTVAIVKKFLRTPYLQVITPGFKQTRKDALKGAEANVVLIQPFKMKTVRKIQSHIADYKAGKIKRPSSTNSSSSLDELQKLAELKNSGVLTQAEFDAKKKQILGL